MEGGFKPLEHSRTKREILSLVRALAPEPTLPDRVEPLGPETIGIPMPGVATWRTFVESLASSGRELPPGQRPKDWTDGTSVAGSALERANEAPAKRSRGSQHPSGSKAPTSSEPGVGSKAPTSSGLGGELDPMAEPSSETLRRVAKPLLEEPDAGNPHVRVRGSPGGAIPWGDPETGIGS